MKIGIGRLIVAALAAMMLTACSSAVDPAVGEGPITLEPAVERAFADYQAMETPRYFAVSEDGRSFYYSFCDARRCRREPKTRTIDRCEAHSAGVPCKIFASQGTIVWSEDGR